MRILHTSDWHLGRSFHREGLLAAQAVFVDHLVETIRSERVDVLVLSGDVFDRALPPVDAVALWDEALTRLADLGTTTVVTSGNHDSARRLGVGARVMRHAGVHLRTDADRLAEPVLVEDAHGQVAIYGLPYLEPEVWRAPWDLPERTHRAALSGALEAVRTDLAGRPGGTRSVVMAHAWVTGGQPSDSERAIAVGGVSDCPAAVFDTIDYVALGHLHGRQRISEQVRYSGSPLAYSFSEARHSKGSWIVELGRGGYERADFVPAPVPRRLAMLCGRIDDLLTAQTHTAHEPDWLQVTLTDPVRPRAAMERLRDRFPHTLVLRFEPDTDPAGNSGRPVPVAGRSDTEIVRDFVTEVRHDPPDAEEAALLQAACEACPGDLVTAGSG